MPLRTVPAAGVRNATYRDWVSTAPAAYCNTRDPDIIRQILPSFDQETHDFLPVDACRTTVPSWKRSFRADPESMSDD